MESRFAKAVAKGSFHIDFDGNISTVRYTLSDDRMQEARDMDPELSTDAGTFDLLRWNAAGDYIDIIPRNTLTGHPNFLKARYAQLETIRLEGFELPIPEHSDDVTALLESLPRGFIRDPEYGLGLPKDLGLVITTVEEIHGVRHLVVTRRRESEIDGDRYILNFDEFDDIRRAINRTHDAALASAREDKRIVAFNALLTARDPSRFPEKKRPYKPDTIFKAVSRSSNADLLSSADRSAALSIVSKSKRELASSDRPALLKLRRDIDLVTIEQLIERFNTLIDANRPEATW